jgi:hypothetical protein
VVDGGVAVVHERALPRTQRAIVRSTVKNSSSSSTTAMVLPFLVRSGGAAVEGGKGC